ncbi:nucleoid occlusion protein [Thomasclavelia cocleata]|uniref:nucleoid occlusion protein n=1 Tax=Thomasclavelia cocleata TaxID=69824 RepID=UPI00242B7660|nr:nucleoid occlusion protein [Thomasclavelia cocleata]
MLEKVYKQIDINKIEANENQPRKVFDDEKIEELATSIKENGLIQPIIVRKLNRSYQIIAGERRFRACKLAGLKTVPCIIKDIDDKQVDTYAIIENIQRENLSPIEEAKAYKTLMDTYSMNQTELANKVGKKQSTIANKLRLLKLSDDVKYALKAKQITERHARAMLSLDKERQQSVLQEVLKKSLNVKQTELLVSKPLKEKSKLKKGPLKAVSQNFKIAINTINQATELIQKSGIPVISETEEADDEYIITLRVKK